MTKMNNFLITVDQGNTATKFAVFENESDEFKVFYKDDLNLYIEKNNLNKKNTKVILSSVNTHPLDWNFPTVNVQDLFAESLFLDMPVTYSRTLGVDRLVLGYYAFYTSKKKTLVIDSGTFTTCDLISETGFNGGYILPGIELIKDSYLRGKQLHKPQKPNHEITELPHSTEDAISQGAVLSILSPIKEIILKNNPENILITGGNGIFLDKSLKKLHFQQDASIQFDSNLIHKALSVIALKGI